MELREYQKECLEKVRNIKPGKYLIQMATGLGKTVTFAQFENLFIGKILIISHREELVSQPEKYFKSEFGKEQAKNKSNGERIISACIQSLIKRLDKFNKDEFEVIIIDECFPAGTLIDNIPIENLRNGDIITSYNHNTKTVEKKKILNTFKSKPNCLVTIKFKNGEEIACTAGHPFYTKQGYLPAIELTNNHEVYSMLESSNKKINKTSDIYLQKDRKNLLFSRMYEKICKKTVIRNNGKNQQEICIRKNENKQSNVQGRNKKESFKKAKGNWSLSKNKIRKWGWIDSSTTKLINCIKRIGTLCRISDSDKTKKEFRIPFKLQSRYSNSRQNDSYRSRWAFSLFNRKTNPRQEKRQFFNWVRVESVKIQEQTSDGTFMGLCKDGYVYNIEVEGNNNYLVKNILVHNCHHAAAKTYQKVLDYFDSKYVFGFTATPNRGDKVGLSDTFQEIIYQKDLKWGIQNKYLCDIECKRVDIGYSLKNVKTVMGDYKVDQLANEVNISAANDAIAEAFYKHAKGQTLIFGINVDHCEQIGERIEESIVVSAKTKNRPDIIKRFVNREFQCLINCMVFTEGTDIPLIETIIFARPTKNASLYVQCIGRGLRPHPDKDKLLLIDCVGTSNELSLCSAPTLIGLKMDNVEPDKINEIEGDLFDLEDKIIETSDCPTSWIKNIKIVDLWAMENSYNTHGVNYFKMPNGDLVLNIPGLKFTIKKADELGNTIHNGNLVNMQSLLDKAYLYLDKEHNDKRAIWDLNIFNKWGNNPASEKQKNVINKKLKTFETKNLTKGEASLILNRLFS